MDDSKKQGFGEVIAQGTHAELMSNDEYVNFTREAKAKVEEEEAKEEESETPSTTPDRVEHTGPDSYQKVQLSQSGSFVEGVESMLPDFPTDAERHPLSTEVLTRDSTELTELIKHFKTRELNRQKCV